MSKIADFIEKTAIEVEDEDIMVIEDLEDTKKITIATLKEIMQPIQGKYIKYIINETLDRVAEKILEAKWDLVDATIFKYKLNTWIGSDSGNIQIALLDMDQNKWLTREELEELFTNSEEKTYKIQTMINHVWEEPVSMRILSFNEEHEFPEEINQWMYEDDAGFLKIHYDDLTANEISMIIYEDIKIEIESTDEMVRYEFYVDRDSFVNAVPYTAKVPMYCPCCRVHYDDTKPGEATKPDDTENKDDNNQEENPPETDNKDDSTDDNTQVGDDLIDDSFDNNNKEDTDDNIHKEEVELDGDE